MQISLCCIENVKGLLVLVETTWPYEGYMT